MQTESPRAGSQHLFNWMAGAWCAAVALVYLAGANREGFWFDEVRTVTDCARPFAAMLRERAFAGHVPLYFALMWGWGRVFGDGEVVSRLPSIAFAIAGLWLLYRLVRRQASPAAGLWAIFFFGLHPMLFTWSAQARMYTLALALALGSLLLLPAAGEKTRSKTALAVLSALLAMTHYMALTIVLAELVYLLARRRPAIDAAAMIAAGALAFIVPWSLLTRPDANLAANLQWTHTLAGGLKPLVAVVEPLVRRDIFAFAPPALIGLAAVTALAAAGVAAGWRRTGIFVLGGLCPLLVALAAGASGRLNLAAADRYFLIVPALLCGLLGVGVDELKRRTRRPVIAYAAAGILTLLLALDLIPRLRARQLFFNRFSPIITESSYREVLQDLDRAATSDSRVVLLINRDLLPELEFYLQRVVRHRARFHIVPYAGRPTAALAPQTLRDVVPTPDAESEVFLLVSRFDPDELAGMPLVAALQGAGYALRSTAFTWKGLVYYFRR